MVKKISVIVPVYNVENYLKQCVDSILNQTYKDLEVFLVDDGSTDNSARICDEYALIDKRVRVYHKENSGQSGARNMALDLVTGDYVAFVDSDDYLAPDMYEKLMINLESYGADISCCSCYMVTDGVVNPNNTIFSNNIVVYDKREDIFSHIFSRPSQLRPEIWNKIFKRSVINNIRFKERQLHQDVYFDHLVFYNAKKVVYVDSPLHYYRVNRPGNTNSKPYNENRLPVLDEFESLSKQLREDGCLLASEKVDVFAMDMIISFYGNSIKRIKKELATRYRTFYSRVKLSTLINTPKFLVFRLTPKLVKPISSLRLLMKR